MESSILSNILRVDLSREKISIENPELHFYRRYLGGWGFVAYYLLKELKKGVDPLSPQNKLIFAAGPVTGVPIAGAGRNAVGAKSPLTGGFGVGEVGGYWGAELKKAGFDAIIVEGEAKDPLYINLRDGKAELRDASHLWGKFTGKTESVIKNELEDKRVRVAHIGPGGEKLVRYACVMNGLNHAAGRTGMGAVMGSKKLKAIAVRGTENLKVNSKEKLSSIRRLFNEKYLKPYSRILEYGTPMTEMKHFVETGNLPIRNFRGDSFSHPERLDPRTVKDEVSLKIEGCFACPVGCKKVVKVEEDKGIEGGVDPKYGGPEYETLGAIGSNCGIEDFKVVAKANELCNKYSLDTISTGVTISFAIECFENGLLSEEDTDGIELRFGNEDAVLKLIELIGKREGLGDLLAEGSKLAAQKIGKEAKKFAIHVKGQEVPMHEPRLKRGLGVGYAVSPTGADHMHNMHDTYLENEAWVAGYKHLGILDPLPLDDLGLKKMRALKYISNFAVTLNSLLLCLFMPWEVHHASEIMRASTGMNMNSWELMKIGERITTMARCFNVREGFTRMEDELPERFFQPHITGALSDKPMNREKFRKAKDYYYKIMGWNNQGIPKPNRLSELDIEWVSDYF